jgi:hypothetical protein
VVVLDSGIKLFIVTCDKCGGKQVWTPETTANPCLGCECVIVKKTVSGPDMKEVKARHKDRELAYSDYEVYTIFPCDIDMVREHNRKKKAAAFKEKLSHKKSVYTVKKIRY